MCECGLLQRTIAAATWPWPVSLVGVTIRIGFDHSRWRLVFGFIAAMVGIGSAGGTGCDRSVNDIARGLVSSDPAARASAAEKAGQLRLVELAPTLIERTRDSVPRVRSASITALSKIGGRQHTDVFVRGLDDPEVAVQISAVRALSQDTSSGSVDHLVALLGHHSRRLRQAAHVALVRLGVDKITQQIRLSVLRLKKDLNDLLNPAIRMRAIERLGDSEREEAVEPLIQLLTRHLAADDLRAVVVALGRIGTVEAIRALGQLEKSPASDRRAATPHGWARLSRPPWDRWRRMLTASDPLVKSNALIALADTQTKLPGEFRDEVCCELLSEHARVATRVVQKHKLDCREQIRELQQRVSRARSFAELDRMLTVLTRVETDRRSVLGALKRAFGRYRAHAVKWVPDAFWKTMDGKPPPQPTSRPSVANRQQALAWLLARFPDRRGLVDREDPLLPSAVTADRFAKLFRHLADGPDERVFLVEVATDTVPDIRIAAFAIIANLPRKRMKPLESNSSIADVVRLGLADENMDIRREAAQGCHHLADATEVALNLLSSGDQRMREGGARCLGIAGDAHHVPRLIGALAYEPSAPVIEALARMKDRRAVAPLLALLGVDQTGPDQAGLDQQQRVLLIHAVWLLRDPKARGLLEELLTDPDVGVRKAAADALSDLGDEKTWGALDACTHDYSADVRRSCSAALKQNRILHSGRRPARSGVH